jgi:polysaccharide biosynthesis protein PslG
MQLQQNPIFREPSRRRRLGPLATLAFFVVLAVALAGCNGQPAPTATPAAQGDATAAPTGAPASTPTSRPAGPAASASAAGTASATRSATAARPQSTQFPMQGPHIGYGMNAWLLPAADPDRSLDLLTGAGFNWVRQWISWDSVEPSPGNYNWKELDALTAAAERHNVKLLIVFLRAPAWADPKGGIPKDDKNKQAYATMLANAAKRYPGKIAAYEIWNEQNMAAETGGKVDPAQYIALLKYAFTAVKAAAPGAFVLYGGLTPTGVNDPSVAVDDAIYLQQSYAFNNGEMKAYFDVLGAHPGGQNNPPDTLWPDNPGPGPGYFDNRSFYFRRIEDLRAVMEKNGDGQKQVWLTEFGWTTKNQAKGYEYGQYVSEQNQADYLVGAYQFANEKYPWVGVMFLWNLNFSTVSKPEDEKTPWSILYADYSPRPAYDTLKKMKK